MTSSNCCFLTCIQVSQKTGRWFGFPISKNFPQFVVIHRGKDFSIVDETEVNVFLEFPCFFYDPADVGSVICGSSAFSKSILNSWKLLVHVLLKPSVENFEHFFASESDESYCAVVEAFFGIAFLWDWKEN